jgi:predicted nucleotidyltransferase component of viral defense system
MIYDVLNRVVQSSRTENLSGEYIKIALKETLIRYTLNMIYNSPRWGHLIFNGGTALKLLGETARLSEDLDLDYVGEDIDAQSLENDLMTYFRGLSVSDIQSSIKQNGKVILLKFPLLARYELIHNPRNQSNWLYVKIELERNEYPAYTLQKTPMMKDNLFFVMNSYDLGSLFANKIGAILGRRDKVYHDQYDYKGRDFYDLIWFLDHKIRPNLERLGQIIQKEHGITIASLEEVWSLLSKRISAIDTNGIYEDLKTLVTSTESIKQLAENYQSIFEGLVGKIAQ